MITSQIASPHTRDSVLGFASVCTPQRGRSPATGQVCEERSQNGFSPFLRARLQAAAAAVGVGTGHHASGYAGGAYPGSSASTAPGAQVQSSGGVAAATTTTPAALVSQLRAAATTFNAPAVLGRVFGRTSTPSAAAASSSGNAQQQQQAHPLGTLLTAATAPPRTASGPLGLAPGQAGGGRPSAGVEAEGSAGSGGAWDVVTLPPSAEAAGAGLLAEGSGGADVAAGVPSGPVLGLHELMGLPPRAAGGAGGQTEADRKLPRAPYRGGTAHRGGCCALAMQQSGALLMPLSRLARLSPRASRLPCCCLGCGLHEHP